MIAAPSSGKWVGRAEGDLSPWRHSERLLEVSSSRVESTADEKEREGGSL
jgi:hypothetical protein